METRPDIVYLVRVAARAIEQQINTDWCLKRRILRYLKGIVDMSIVYHSGAQTGILTAYSEAYFAGDVSSRKSTSGVVCM